MIPVAFDYERATSAEHALALLAEHGDDAKLLAGGHSLLPLMKYRLAAPALVVDIGRLSDLSYVREDGDVLAIGALTRHRDVETSELVRAQAGLLAAATSKVGDPQVRHRGTLGGSLAHGDPASDLPAALIKFNRRAQDWAIVGAAVVVDGGSCGVGLVNMDSRPVRAAGVEAAVDSGTSAADAAGVAADGLEPPSDLNAGVEYRCHLARVLTRRGLEEAGC